MSYRDQLPIENYLDEATISSRVDQLAQQIGQDYGDEEIVVVAVLNGSFMFCSDLIKKITSPVTLEFIAVSSYGSAMTSSGEIDFRLDLKKSIENKNVLIVEDIVDTGLTLTHVLRDFKKRGPRDIKVCSLLHKPAKTVHKVDIDYLAFEIKDEFVVGYGLDLDGRFRELPYIGIYRGES